VTGASGIAAATARELRARGHPGQCADRAGAVLVRPDADAVTGQVLDVDGGWWVTPAGP